MTYRILFATLALAATSLAQNPYLAAAANVGVVNDLRARKVGDILTITVREATSVKNEDKVERSSESSLASRLEAFTLSSDTFKSSGLPRIDLRKETSFDGEAKQKSDSEVRASIAVIVVDVQPNGNMVVAGTRQVTVNDETRTLKISGLVRSLDVTTDNTVTSAQVADARIAITGDGGNTRQVTRGPVGQLFDTILWAVWPF